MNLRAALLAVLSVAMPLAAKADMLDFRIDFTSTSVNCANSNFCGHGEYGADNFSRTFSIDSSVYYAPKVSTVDIVLATPIFYYGEGQDFGVFTIPDLTFHAGGGGIGLDTEVVVPDRVISEACTFLGCVVWIRGQQSFIAQNGQFSDYTFLKVATDSHEALVKGYYNITLLDPPPSAVPLPASLPLLASGLVAMAWMGRRRRALAYG